MIEILFGNKIYKIKAAEDETVLQAARAAGLPVYAPCGGAGTCGKCKVILENRSEFSALTDRNRHSVLPDSDYENGVRLACRLTALPGMKVRIMDSGCSDTGKGGADGSGLTKSAASARVGAAVDIGTTTLVCYLHDLDSGARLAVRSARNPQCVFGADVITRMEYSLGGEAERMELRNSVRNAIGILLSECFAACGAVETAFEKIVLAGNAVMAHLFWGWDCTSLARYPFEQVDASLQMSTAAACGWEQLPSDARVYFLPGIGSFVGADTTAAMLALQAGRDVDNCVLIDIGTNGEVVLYRGGRRYACSAAAGPAFEGARISQGMLAGKGAITSYRLKNNGEDETGVYDGTVPSGICGSGLIEVVNEFVKAGLVTESGRIAASEEVNAVYRGRISGEGRQREIAVTADAAVRLTQKDIRELQLAKGAIRAAIGCLLAHADMKVSDIEKIYVAGAFGSKITAEGALGIALLPTVEPFRIVFTGNAAGEGAVLCLLDERLVEESVCCAQETEHLDISSSPVFQTVFTDGMNFS